MLKGIHYFVYDDNDELVKEGEPYRDIGDAIDCARTYKGRYIAECEFFTNENGERDYTPALNVWAATVGCFFK